MNVSLAAAKEISEDAVVTAVLSRLDGNSTLKEEQRNCTEGFSQWKGSYFFVSLDSLTRES